MRAVSLWSTHLNLPRVRFKRCGGSKQAVLKEKVNCYALFYRQKSRFFVNCYALFYRMASLSGMHHRARASSPEEKCLLDRCQTQIFLAVTGL